MASLTRMLFLLPFLWSCNTAEKTTENKAKTTRSSNADCDTLIWNYTNVGEPFMLTWCTMCHHSDLEEGERGGASGGSEAPISVNLDGYSNVNQWLTRISVRVNDESSPMPPAGGPSDAEIARLNDWIECGAPQ